MDKVAIVSANLGGFEKEVDHIPQSTPCDAVHFTDQNFPPRRGAMTPRLQARLVKMFMWQLVPNYEYYLWVDSSCVLSHKDSVKWFLQHLGKADMAVFKHPRRDTVQEEADYLKRRLELERAGKKRKYILPRYENELIDEQLAVVDPEQELYASTVFIYRNTPKVRRAMTDWWHHTSRYHLIDQLSLPFVLFENAVEVNSIEGDYLKCPYLEFTR